MEIPQEVKLEIENIKQFATEEEKSNLDIQRFNGLYRSECIYGLMTGDCRSERAKILIKKCTKSLTSNKEAIEINNWEEFLTLDYFYSCDLITPLERLILHDQEIGIKIILYIQNLITEL